MTINKNTLPIADGVFHSQKRDWDKKLINDNYPTITFQEEHKILTEGHTPDYKEHYRNIVQKFNNPIIVDFGGGVGIDYQLVKDLQSIYIIVETPSTCSYAETKREIFSTIKFFDDIFKINQKINIFYSSGGIQYAMDIFKIIKYINKILQPKYILLHKTRFTPQETYLAQQVHNNCYHWLFNLENFTQKFTNYTYEILPEEHFPSYYRCYGVSREICEYIPLLFTRIIE